MNTAILEHVNYTVKDAKATAERLCKLFDWTIRWHGPALDNGTSYHVGGSETYLAVYKPAPEQAVTEPISGPGLAPLKGLNHVGIVVKDLDAAEARITAMGYEPFSHRDYEPGRRFYFRDEDGIEYEIVSYA